MSEYGEDMVVLFRDQCRDASVRGAFSRAALDLAITVPTQRLEAVMRRNPQALVPLIYLAIALGGLVTAIVGGSDPTMLVIGLALALIAGAIGVVAWRRSVPVRESSLTGSWWMFLGAGPGLVAVVIGAAAVGVEAWFLGMMTVLLALVLTIVGLGLGVAHLLSRRDRRDPPVTFNAGT